MSESKSIEDQGVIDDGEVYLTLDGVLDLSAGLTVQELAAKIRAGLVVREQR